MHYRQHRYRWVLLSALWLVYFSFGLIVFSLAPLVTTIRTDLGLSKGAIGTVLGAWPLVYIAAALPSGALIDRLGLRRSLGIGATLIAISALLRSLAGGFGALFGAVAVFGLGGPLVSVGAPKLVSVWFDPKERPLAMGITMTGPAIGGVVALVTANGLLMPLFNDSWRNTLLVYAGVAVAVIAVWMVVATAAERIAPGADRNTGGVGGFSGARELLGQPAILLLLAIALGVFFYSHALNGWLPTVIEEQGFSSSTAGYLAGGVSALSIAGALLLTRFTPESNRLAVLAGVFFLFGLSAVLLSLDIKTATFFSLVIIGLGKGSAIPLAQLVMMQTPKVTSRNMGAAGGLFFTAGEIGGVTGPFLFGLLSETSGSTSGLILLTGVIVAAAVLTLLLRPVTSRNLKASRNQTAPDR